MINHINVERLAKIFIGFFVDLNFNDKLKDVTFLEIFLGFVYSIKKVTRSLILLNIFTEEQFKKIGDILDSSIKENVKIEVESELYKLLKIIKDAKEEKENGKESKNE